MERGAAGVEAPGRGGSRVRVSLGDARRLLAGDGRVLAGLAERLGESGRHLVDAVRRPLGRAALRLGAPATPWTIALRWSPASGLVLVPDPDAAGVLDVVTCPAASLPDVVAGVCGLGPRPRSDVSTPIVLPVELLDVWLRGAPRSVLDAAVDDPGVRAGLIALRRGLRLTWAVTSELPSGDGSPLSRSLRTVDAGDAGLWLVHRVAERGGVAILDPTTAGTVWDLLCGVLATRPLAEVPA